MKMTQSTLSEFSSIGQVLQAYRSKKISPSELTALFLKEAKPNPQNAFLNFFEEESLAKALWAERVMEKEGVDEALRQFPLLGVPAGIKDNMLMKQGVTSCASKLLKNYRAPYTATAIKRLEDAGAIILGKLNLDEFAMGGSNENSAFGPVLHPTHPDRVPGGSSGGSAAAVRAGHCVFSLGSDTGGSIRLPASFCDLVGLKPSYGRVSRSGLIAFASSLDQIGPLTRNVQDAALVLDILSGLDPQDASMSRRERTRTHTELSLKLDFSKLSIGIPKEYFVEGLQNDVELAVEASMRRLEAWGAKLVPISMPHSQYSVAVYYILAVCEAASNLARFDGVRYGHRAETLKDVEKSTHSLEDFYSQNRHDFGSEVKRRIILGTFALSSGYARDFYRQACQVRRQIAEDFKKAFQEIDLILGPVAPVTAFKLGQKISDPLQMYLNDLYTIPANLTGVPAISVPCAYSHEGLPIGLQLMAPAFEESLLLRVSEALWQDFNGRKGQ